MGTPTPNTFTDFRTHLHTAQIDAAYLALVLEQYLNLPDNLPRSDWQIDLLAEHHAQACREAINTFRQMILDKPE